MKQTVQNITRPVLIGGIAAWVLALIGSYLASDLSQWWWQTWSVGSAILIVLLISLVPAKGVQILRRVYLAGALSSIVVVGAVYGVQLLASFQSGSLVEAFGDTNSVATVVAMNGFISGLLLRRHTVVISILTLGVILLTGVYPVVFVFIGGLICLWLAKSFEGSRERRKVKSALIAGAVLAALVFLPAQVNALVSPSRAIDNSPAGNSQAALPCNGDCLGILAQAPHVTERLPAQSLNSVAELANGATGQQQIISGFLEQPIAGYGRDALSVGVYPLPPERQAAEYTSSWILRALYERGLIGLLSISLLLYGVVVAVQPPRVEFIALLIFALMLPEANSTLHFNFTYYPFWLTIPLLGRTKNYLSLPEQSHSMSAWFLATVDIIVVALAIGVAYEVVGPQTQSGLFFPLLSGSAIVGFFLARAWKPLLPFVAGAKINIYIVPVIAATLAVLVSALMRGYYSLGGTLVFLMVSFVGLAVTRFTSRHMQPPVRLLLVGQSSCFTYFENRSDIHVTHLDDRSEIEVFDYVVIGSSGLTEDERNRWLKSQIYNNYTVYSDVKASEVLLGRIPPHSVTSQWVSESRERIKRLIGFKRVIETLMILLAAPIILVVAGFTALVVLITSGSPVIFTQERVGLNNKVFKIYKFRSMSVEATENAAFANEETERITRVGKILRGFRLDEIPQFWNVLKGDMSIIGPRPEQVEFVRQFEAELPAYSARHIAVNYRFGNLDSGFC